MMMNQVMTKVKMTVLIIKVLKMIKCLILN